MELNTFNVDFCQILRDTATNENGREQEKRRIVMWGHSPEKFHYIKVKYGHAMSSQKR